MQLTSQLTALEHVLGIKLPVVARQVWEAHLADRRWLPPHKAIERTLQLRELGQYYGRKWVNSFVVVGETDTGDIEVVRGGSEDPFSLKLKHDSAHRLNAFSAERAPLQPSLSSGGLDV